MAYLGAKQLGDTVALLLWSRDLDGLPTAPDAAPTVEIWSDDLIETISLPAYPNSDAKVFFYELFLSKTAYTPGTYYLHYEYILSGDTLTAMDVLEIRAGGDSEGPGISMHFFRQPAGDFVLMQGRSGRVLRLKNPSL